MKHFVDNNDDSSPTQRRSSAVSDTRKIVIDINFQSNNESIKDDIRSLDWIIGSTTFPWSLSSN